MSEWSKWWKRCAAQSSPETGRVRGRALRYLLTLTLRDAGRPLTVRELAAHCEHTGVVFEGRASKIVSDSLRWEMARGRVRRLSRGVYCVGRIPGSTLRFIRRRWAEFLELLRSPVLRPVGIEGGYEHGIPWGSGLLADPNSG